MFPSIKTLRLVAGSKAPELRRLLDGRIKPTEYDSVKQWINQCFNVPSENELIMFAANEIVGHYGVESIRCNGAHGSYYGDIHAVYTNSGDCYKHELIYDVSTGRYIVSTFAGYIERQEKKRNNCTFN